MSKYPIKPVIPYDLNEKNARALKIRNRAWKANTEIPSWVDRDSVGLDQFFTCPVIARQCWKKLYDFMRAEGVEPSSYTFIEPSAGLGAFYDLLPPHQRIGIDVVPFRSEYIQSEFLSWKPQKKGYHHVCVGNPPFGARAWLALLFINHAAQFCDYVGFILPMGFQNSGQGSLAHRVQGLNLVHSSVLPSGSFIRADGTRSKINTLWQIWSRKTSIPKKPLKTCDQYIDLFSINRQPGKRCGQKRLKEAHCFLERTFFTRVPKLVLRLDQIKHQGCIGIVIKRDKAKVLHVLRNTDWMQYSNLALNHSRHIGITHVRQALTDQGLFDD